MTEIKWNYGLAIKDQEFAKYLDEYSRRITIITEAMTIVVGMRKEEND